MSSEFHEGEVFENIDYSEKSVSKAEFSQCKFVNCNFTKSNLSNTDFSECEFNNCNFSLTKFANAGLKDVKFINSKILGIDFTLCRDLLFSVSFKGSILDYSSFIKMKMKKTPFTDCSLKEVDFEETDLSAAIFNNCDLAGAKFMRTNLEKADFSTSHNYSFDPEANRIKQAKFSQSGALGLLDKYGIEIE